MFAGLSQFVNYLRSFFRNSGTYWYMIIDFLNANLSFPVSTAQKYLSIDATYFPLSPVNFITMIVLMFFSFVTFTNNFVCNLVGLAYPLFYGVKQYDEQQNTVSDMDGYTKYWMLYAMLVLFESFFGCVLSIVPGYFYCKFVLLCCLMRNNFAFSDRAFGMVHNYVTNYKLPGRASLMLESYYPRSPKPTETDSGLRTRTQFTEQNDSAEN